MVIPHCFVFTLANVFMLVDTNAYKMLFSAENQTKVLLNQTTITSLLNFYGTPRKTHKACRKSSVNVILTETFPSDDLSQANFDC
jgi:hypothetical protein